MNNQEQTKKDMKMKRTALLMMAVMLVASGFAGAQTRKDIRDARKEAADAARMLKREGYAPIELGKMEPKLEKFFLKVYAGCPQVVGVADNCMNTNLAQVTAMANAANQYALLVGGDIRGRMISSTTSMGGQEMDNLVSSFERIVEKEIRGELVPYVTAVRTRRGKVSARAYCIVDQDAAYRLRRRAMEIALEEQNLAEAYGSRISEWIDEGFGKGSD